MLSMIPHGAILVQNFPKRCSCGRRYDERQWNALEFVGPQEDEVEKLELRNCPRCNSTIAIILWSKDPAICAMYADTIPAPAMVAS
jgi:formate dehydrogenase maturation protein FdhE